MRGKYRSRRPGAPSNKGELFAEALAPKELTPSQLEGLAARLAEKADQSLKSGMIPPSKEDRLAGKWRKLEHVARELDVLCQKQLRHQQWNEEDERFLKTYGETIAGIMGYDGNSWLTPLDDAPRWVEVCGFPAENKSLAVGIGRPRALYVLYPWNGREVLCVGSVMQYNEYRTSQRLTDREWLKLIDSDEAPELPVWLSPYASKPGKPAALR